jgi:hypothetical protein
MVSNTNQHIGRRYVDQGVSAIIREPNEIAALFQNLWVNWAVEDFRCAEESKSESSALRLQCRQVHWNSHFSA